MHLDIADPVDDLHVLAHFFRHIPAAHRIQRQPHGKQGVRISPEHLPVEEIPPASAKLADEQSEAAQVQKRRDADALDLANRHRRRPARKGWLR